MHDRLREDSPVDSAPFLIFGDFNFRLDVKALIQVKVTLFLTLSLGIVLSYFYPFDISILRLTYFKEINNIKFQPNKFKIFIKSERVVYRG